MEKTNILEDALEAVAKGLREFGYPDVTKDMIREHHAAWKKGEEGEGVIFLFAKGYFEDHVKLFGTPDV